MYIILELADCEPVGLLLLDSTRSIANAHFEACMEENGVHEMKDFSLDLELPGTLRIAGDDSYSVALIQKSPK